VFSGIASGFAADTPPWWFLSALLPDPFFPVLRLVDAPVFPAQEAIGSRHLVFRRLPIDHGGQEGEVPSRFLAVCLLKQFLSRGAFSPLRIDRDAFV